MRLIFWRVVLDYSLIAIIASLVASDPDHLSLIVSHLGDYSSSLFNCFHKALFHNSIIISLFKTMLVLRVYPCKDVYRLICSVCISSQGCIPLDTQYLVCCIKLSFSLLGGFVLYPNFKSYQYFWTPRFHASYGLLTVELHFHALFRIKLLDILDN